MDHRIKPGETLTSLARRYGTSVEALARHNQIARPDALRVGQTIQVPVVARDAVSLSPGAQARQPAEAAPAAAPSRLSEAEIEVLTRAVAAEARGESREVWVAVAQAILNYAERNGKSLARLVRSSYLSSNYDGNKRYYTMPTGRIENYQAMREAVLAAARGESPIGDRMHFHDTSIRTPRWGDSGSRLQIGRMVFFDPRG